MRFNRMVLCFVSLIVGTTSLFAQAGATGTILGTVTDSQGAVVTNAAVEITNLGTNIVNNARTTSSGDYTVTFLPPGTYKVSVKQEGFQQSVADHVTLVVGQQQRVNFSLKPGTVSEQVVVQASAVALETDSAAVSQLVSQKQVEDLPLNGRNFMQLLFIGEGAVQTGGEQGTMRQGQGQAISINGSRPESNNYLLDGMLNTDQALNTPAVVLSVDAIQEFKVLSQTYSSQYGFGANQISIVSKSGTNQFHGSAFEFNRQDGFDARNYFLPTTSKKDKLRQNQFGYVLGGPVLIPKIYDGKNKTFFLANYEGWRVLQGGTAYGFVPDPAVISGHFTHAVIDPVTKAAFPGCTANGTTYVSCVPQTRYSRLANVAMKYNFFPAPNCVGCALGNYNFSTVLPADTDQQTYRLDQDLGKWGHIFGRGTYSSSNSVGNGSLSPNRIGTTTFGQQQTNWAVSHTIALKQNIVNQFSFGRLNAATLQGGYEAPASVISELNYTGIFQNLTGGARVFPVVRFANVTGQTQLGQVGGAVNAFTTSVNPMWQYVDTLTINVGKHTLTTGGDYKRWKLDRNVANNFLGNIQFSNYATGDQFADFLLGTYSTAGTNVPAPFTPSGVVGNPYQYNFQYFATYLQDDWKVNQRLTLNLGVRWDLRTVPYETSNHMGWFDPTNPKGGICIADPKVFSQGYAGTTGYYRNCGTNTPAGSEKKNFAPRVGFAWRPWGEKTVLRGGYGLFWDGVEGREMDGAAGFYPFQGTVGLNQFSAQQTYATTDSLFPSFAGGPVIPGPTGQNSAIVVTLPAAPWLHNPYVQQYTFSVQRELARNTILEVGYSGNKGTHLLTRNQFNQAYPMKDPAFCAIAANRNSADCPVAVRRPYSNFNIWIDDRFIGYSNYNAGNVKLERRATSMALTAVYSWAKGLDIKSAAAGVGASQPAGGWSGYLNNHNTRMDYGRSDYDVGQRFTASMVYNLPFGRGQTFLSDINRLANAAVGGWQVSTIYLAQLGFPMAVTAGDTFGLLDSFGNNRAQLAAGQKPTLLKTKAQWFNTGAFSQPAPNTFGNSARGALRMPGINNFDIGLLKTVSFTERVGLQLRFESFNTFNHPQFNPDPSVAAFAGGSSTVSNNVNSPTYGKITGAAPGRILQLGGKFTF